ncbi:MAG: WG repeat-containing protein [Firmicutes bacterium]|nr:WG repeat-containing protein [Bacillota bacterium]
MKKIVILPLCCIIAGAGAVCAQEILNAVSVDFRIYIDNQEMDFNNETVTINDRTYVPLRELSEAMGLSVTWDEENKSVYIEQPAEVLYPFEDENYMWGFKDADGNVVVEAIYYYVEEFSDGLALVRKSGGQNGQYGYIDVTGEEVIPCRYYNACSFSDGLAVVSLATATDESKFAYINKDGDFAFDKTFEMAYSFHDGYAVVLKEGSIVPRPNADENAAKWSYIDKTGDFATEMTFDTASNFSGGRASVTLDGISGTIDADFVFTPDEE